MKMIFEKLMNISETTRKNGTTKNFTHKKRSIEIGENGYKIGKKYFDYTTNGKEVFNFIKTNNI